jgi:hypothetical protein
MKTWIPVAYDLTRILTQLNTRHIRIPSGLKLELEVQLDDAAYDELDKDSTWIQKLHDKANGEITPVLEEIKKKVLDVEHQTGNKVTTPANLAREINELIKHRLEAIGPVVSHEIETFFENYKKGKKDLLKFRIKTGVKISLNALTIVSTAAIIGATKGGAAPVGVVVIVRSIAKISEGCVAVALSADKWAARIQVELAALQTILVKDMSDAGLMKKARQISTDIGLEAIAGITGIETPSLGTCREHIKVHKLDISKLEIESHSLGNKIHEAMDEERKWQNEFEAAARTMPAEKVGKVSQRKDKVRAAVGRLLEANIKVNDAVARAQQRQEKFETALNAMMKGVPSWITLVKPATDLAFDLGAAIGGAHSIVEGTLDATSALVHEIDEVLIDKL